MAKNSCQKKPNYLEILGTKVVQFLMLHKIDKNKKVTPRLMFFIQFFLERFKEFLTLKIDFHILALFDVYFWPFNKSHENINTIFVISAVMASI